MYMNIEPYLPASVESCKRDLRAIFLMDGLIDLFLNLQREYYFKLKGLENLTVNERTLLSQYKAAHNLRMTINGHISRDKISLDSIKEMETLQFKAERKMRPKPDKDWLLDHQGYVIQLRVQGYSYRRISNKIFSRFRKEISYETIRKFLLKKEDNNGN